jgi:hypothetical protein
VRTKRPTRSGSAGFPAITADIPARLDRLPWSRFHVLVVIALGVTRILDGLEVTIVGAIGPVLKETGTLGLTAQEIWRHRLGLRRGAVCGALVFGWLTDRFTAWTQTIARKVARYRLGPAPTFICNCMGYRVLSR